MKRIISLIHALVLILSLTVCAVAATEKLPPHNKDKDRCCRTPDLGRCQCHSSGRRLHDRGAAAPDLPGLHAYDAHIYLDTQP